MPLVKPEQVVLIPGSPAIEGRPASLVCVPPPPPPVTAYPPPSVPPSAGTPIGYYVYVPNNPNNPAAGEVRTFFSSHPGGSYICDTEPQTYFIDSPASPGTLLPVRERRCYWQYPP